MSTLSNPRILIVRLSAIGDCILTTPLIHALRRQFPDAHLAWAVEKPAAQLLQGHVGLDEIIVVPRKWLKSPRTIIDVRRQLRSRRFDVAIDPQSLSKSALLAWLSGAKVRIGFSPPEGRELAPWLFNRRIEAINPHIVDRSLELLLPLGIYQPEVRFELPHYPAAGSVLDDVLPMVADAEKFALLNVGAGWPSKLWVADRFASVARHLGEHHGLTTVVLWSGDERMMAAQVVDGADGHAVLAPNTSLTELITLARRARLFVGCDTGPLHMAAAVGTPCVGLYGPTRPDRCGPYGSLHVTVEPPVRDAKASMRSSKDNRAMREIDASRVCLACDEILDRAAGGAAGSVTNTHQAA